LVVREYVFKEESARVGKHGGGKLDYGIVHRELITPFGSPWGSPNRGESPATATTCQPAAGEVSLGRSSRAQELPHQRLAAAQRIAQRPT
jgi:hypothetical protein